MALGIFMLGLMPLLAWIERSMLFHPDAAPLDLRYAEATPGLERLFIDSSQGRVEAFFIPGRGVSPSAPGPLVVYAHGNAEVIDPLPRWLDAYRQMGVSVLIPEYRGYGRSEGRPSEAAIRDDLVAFYDLVIDRPEIDRERVVYHGVSLGGGAVAQLASQRPPTAFILQSTFTSVSDIAWDMLSVPRILIADRFDSIAVHRASPRPTLILHGTQDDLVPVRHALALQRAIPGSRLVQCAAGHNDLPPPEFDYWGEIERFLERSGIVHR